jgi:hypothetical protein
MFTMCPLTLLFLGLPFLSVCSFGSFLIGPLWSLLFFHVPDKRVAVSVTDYGVVRVSSVCPAMSRIEVEIQIRCESCRRKFE